ncbi:MAG: hypothetical protein ACXWCZ_04405 [Flavisolibacter sp.]
MRSAVAIFLLVLVVSVQTPVGQLFKLPLLIEHFIKHQNQNGISLIDFLEVHYTTGHNDADLPEDEQLPFKRIFYDTIGYAIVPGVIKTNVFVPLPADIKVFFFDTYAPQQHLASIFHPPRM